MLRGTESPTNEEADSECISVEPSIVAPPTDNDQKISRRGSDDEPDSGMYRGIYDGHEILSEDEDVFIDEEVRIDEKRIDLVPEETIEKDANLNSLHIKSEQEHYDSFSASVLPKEIDEATAPIPSHTRATDEDTENIAITEEPTDIRDLQQRTLDLLKESKKLRISKLEREKLPSPVPSSIIETGDNPIGTTKEMVVELSDQNSSLMDRPVKNHSIEEKGQADVGVSNSAAIDMDVFETRLRLLESKAKSGLSREASKRSLNDLDSDSRIPTSDPISSANDLNEEEAKNNAMLIIANIEEKFQNRESLLHDLQGWAVNHLPSTHAFDNDEEYSPNESEKNNDNSTHVSIEDDPSPSYNEALYNSIFSSESEDEIPHEEGALLQKYKRNDVRGFTLSEPLDDSHLDTLSSTSGKVLTQYSTLGEKSSDRMAVLGIQNISESYHLELEVIRLREENMLANQKFMDQLEQNQIYRQDLDVVTDKCRSLEKRLELVDKVNRQKQVEFEKKTRLFTKTIEDLQARVQSLQEEKTLSQQNYEAQTQSLIFEVSMNAEKARQKESALKSTKERCDSLEQHLRSTKTSLNESIENANRLEEENKALISERNHVQSEAEAFRKDIESLNLKLREELKKIAHYEKIITENNSTIDDLKSRAWEREPEQEDIRRSVPMKAVSIQTVGKPLEKKKMIRQQLEATTLNYLDMSRTACGSVKKSHDEFVSRLLHVVRNQIPDTMSQFLNYFGAKNRISDIVVDEWIDRLRQTYEKHINAVRLMSEKQNSLYNDVFSRKDMLDTQKEILTFTDKILFEDNDDGFRIEQGNQAITQEMYNEITMQMRALHNEVTELREENEMLKAHISVMERTQGKLSNVAELERQLKRCQVKLETAQEEYEEYFTKSVALEQDLEQLKSAVRRSNLIILTEEGASMPGEVEGQEQNRNKPQLIRVQSLTLSDGLRSTSSKDSMLSIESLDSKEGLGQKIDSLSDTTATATSTALPDNGRVSPNPLPPMPQRRQSQISLQSLLDEGQQYRGRDSKDIFEEGKQLALQMREQVNGIEGAIKLLVGKVTEHERKKLKRTDINAPEWLLAFVDERSTELMRAAERLVVKYIKLSETFEQKIDTFMNLEQKLMEKEVGEYKELSELNFLRMTEDALQQHLDQLMLQACQHYPLRSVKPQQVHAEITAFLEKQPVVLQEILPNVLSKFVTLHKACTNYIDQLLEESDEDLEALTDDGFSHGPSHKALARLQTLSRRQSTGSILTEESSVLNGSVLMASGVVNPEFGKANEIVNRADELREEKVAARFLYWIYRLKLQRLQVELFAIESRSGPDENQALMKNFQTQIALQKKHCGRLQRRLKKIDRRVNRNLSASLETLVAWMKGEKKVLQQRLYETSSAGRRHKIQNASVPEGELLSSSWKYSAKKRDQNLRMAGKGIKPSRLQLKTREPLEREKLVHLQKQSKAPERAWSPKASNSPLLQEQRVPQGNFSIFRPKTEKQASFLPKVSSSSNVPETNTNSAYTIHSSTQLGGSTSGQQQLSVKAPKRVTRTAGATGAYGAYGAYGAPVQPYSSSSRTQRSGSNHGAHPQYNTFLHPATADESATSKIRMEGHPPTLPLSSSHRPRPV